MLVAFLLVQALALGAEVDMARVAWDTADDDYNALVVHAVYSMVVVGLDA
jgi:hypothetical protein